MHKLKQLAYLTGFMTSGKSSIGPALANTLGWDFYDLDIEISSRMGKSVPEIFEEYGENYFRNLEKEVLKALSASDNSAVIALGGGTIASDENLKLIKNTGTLIYLKASVETLYNRLKSKFDRPLFKGLTEAEAPKEEYIKKITELLDKRSFYYEQADLIISTDDYTLGKSVDKIASYINHILHEKNKD